MNEIQIFNNEEFGPVRTLLINSEPWFVGKDVAVALGYENSRKAIADHVDDEDKIMGSQNVTPSIADSLGRTQYPTWINESGLYSLIFGSRLESAKRFKRWVTSEVLPAIRKTGSYREPNVYKVKDTSLGEITSFVREMDKVMRDQNSHPSDIADAFKCICTQFGVRLPDNFVREPAAVEPVHFMPLPWMENGGE